MIVEDWQLPTNALPSLSRMRGFGVPPLACSPAQAVFRLSTPVPDDPALAAAAFVEVLAACGRERRLCLVLDGLHCAGPGTAGAPSLLWLPLPPPSGVSIVASAHSSFPLAKAIAHVAHGAQPAGGRPRPAACAARVPWLRTAIVPAGFCVLSA